MPEANQNNTQHTEHGNSKPGKYAMVASTINLYMSAGEDSRLPGVTSRVPVVQASSWPTHCVPLQTRYHVCSVSLHLTAKLLPSRCSHVEPYGATSAQPRAAHKQTCLMYIAVSTHTHRFLYSRTYTMSIKCGFVVCFNLIPTYTSCKLHVIDCT